MKAIGIGPIHGKREFGEYFLRIPIGLQHPEWVNTDEGEEKLDEVKEAALVCLEGAIKEVGLDPRTFESVVDWGDKSSLVMISLPCKDEQQARAIGDNLKPKLTQIPDADLVTPMLDLDSQERGPR